MINHRKIIDKATINKITPPELQLLISSMYNDMLNMQKEMELVKNQFKGLEAENKHLKNYLAQTNFKLRGSIKNQGMQDTNEIKHK